MNLLFHVEGLKTEKMQEPTAESQIPGYCVVLSVNDCTPVHAKNVRYEYVTTHSIIN